MGRLGYDSEGRGSVGVFEWLDDAMDRRGMVEVPQEFRVG